MKKHEKKNNAAIRGTTADGKWEILTSSKKLLGGDNGTDLGIDIHEGAVVVDMYTDENEEPLKTLNDEEEQLLAQCETDIEKNKSAFLEMAFALRTIFEQRLYLKTHRTFDLYCAERWQFSANYAYRCIKGANIAESIVPRGNTDPIVNESQARVLDGVPEEKRQEVYEMAAQTSGEDAPPAKALRKAKAKICGDQKPKQQKARLPKEQDTPVTPEEEEPKEQQEDEAGEPQPGSSDKVIPFPVDSSLPSVTEMADWATSAYNLFSNTTRKQYVLGLIGKLKNALDAYSRMEKQQAA